MMRRCVVTLVGATTCIVALSADALTSDVGASHASEANNARSAHAQPESQPEYLRTLNSLRSLDTPLTPWPDGWAFDVAYNREAPVPPQCYTRHEAKHNPCYVCHQNSKPGFENLQRDHELQSNYDFSDLGFTNQWTNLFEDRRERIDGISDEEITMWIRQDNYSELAPRLRDAGFAGWIPDLANLEQAGDAFDHRGLAKDGSHWIAFNYKPFPSTFWPTNGATDDVMIRLPNAFRTTDGGEASFDVYAANLALLETGVKNIDAVTSFPIDERVIGGVDLDGNGELGTATRVLRRSHFVGAASDRIVLQTMYPQGTEFLHTVRYIDVDEHGMIVPSTRMKEVRYMKRLGDRNRADAAYHYLDEMLDKEEGKLPRHRVHREERGLESETGWFVSGFIEGHDGRLRANTFDETLFCMGCHNSVGATIDKTFSFARKIDGREGWGYLDLVGMPDVPSMGSQRGEIVEYLERVGGGSEFRNNDEMRQRFFTEDGTVNHDAVAEAKDVYDLITPSPERAMKLNKAYRVIVEDQDYVYGRDPLLAPPANVYDRIDPDTAPTLPEDRIFVYDIRLDWSEYLESTARRDVRTIVTDTAPSAGGE